jgi:hypothetical protein
VSLVLEGGKVVESYGGSRNVDARNQMSFGIDLPLRKEFGVVILKAFDKRRSPGPEDQPLGGER